MYLNIFYKSPVNYKNKQLSIESSDNYANIHQRIAENENIPVDGFILLYNGHILREDDNLKNDDNLQVHVLVRGGKGGFGSMLRAIGAQIEKTTNREACRDLSGRRLRDINEEKRIKNWIEKQAARKKEQERRKKEKLEKLKSIPNAKCEFNDVEYNKNRSEIPEIIDDALKYGLQVEQQKKEQQQKKDDNNLPSTSAGTSNNSTKRKADDIIEKELKKSKKSFWLGFELDDEELEELNDVEANPEDTKKVT